MFLHRPWLIYQIDGLPLGNMLLVGRICMRSAGSDGRRGGYVMGLGQHNTAKKFRNRLPLLNGLFLSRGNRDLLRN